MAGNLMIHPLTKSYDQLRQTRERLKAYISTHKMEIDDTFYTTVLGIIASLDDLAVLIPEQYRKTPYEIQKMHKERRG